MVKFNSFMNNLCFIYDFTMMKFMFFQVFEIYDFFMSFFMFQFMFFLYLIL